MLPRDEVIQFYSHAAVFCCPSVYEPFGIINLEAMACETAVVASAVGGIPEVVVPRGDRLSLGRSGAEARHLRAGRSRRSSPRAWPRASTRWRWIPTLREKFGRNGRRRVEDHFSWTAIAQRTLDLYRSLERRVRSSNELEEEADAELEEGRTRVIIESVTPRVDDGAVPDQAHRRRHGDRRGRCLDRRARRDLLRAALQTRKATRSGPRSRWSRWATTAGGLVHRSRRSGRYRYTVSAWVDHFKTWSRDLAKRVEAGQDVTVDLLIGAEMVDGSRQARAPSKEAGWHELYAEVCARGWAGRHRARAFGRVGAADAAARRARSRLHLRAASSASWSIASGPASAPGTSCSRARARPCPGRHGTFKDVEARLPYVASMGFDVLYLPPIHPIGRSFRKGRNNSTVAGPDDPGSPWAIGSAEGGHKAIHPELGTLDDFRHLVERAAAARPRDGAGYRFPVRARSSLRHGASGVVPAAPGWHDPVCREPAQEVPGHLPVRLRDRRSGASSGTS